MAVTLGGNPIEVSGTFPKVGDTAPDFKLVNKDLADVSLADFAGKKKILNIVPSLDTPVCAISTKKFNEAAVGNTAVLIISADLPFAMSRFCGAESTNNVGDAVDHAWRGVHEELRRRHHQRPACRHHRARRDGARRGQQGAACRTRSRDQAGAGLRRCAGCFEVIFTSAQDAKTREVERF